MKIGTISYFILSLAFVFLAALANEEETKLESKSLSPDLTLNNK